MKGTYMVAPSAPDCTRAVSINFARAFLFRSADALERGDLLAAGVLLRESCRRQLFAECEWHNCLPQSASDRTPPVTLLKALARAGHTNPVGYSVAKECIEIGNRAAHCQYVADGAIRGCIGLWHSAIDHDPCLQPVNMRGNFTSSKPWHDPTDDDPLANADYDRDDIDDDDEGGAKVKGGAA